MEELPFLRSEEPLSGNEKWFYERLYRTQGFSLIAGIDEAGRGPLAGPVVAAAVIFSDEPEIEGLDDSKKVSPKTREQLIEPIKRHALAVGIGLATVEEIDSLNILQATRKAMVRAIGRLNPPPDFLLTDAVPIVSLEIGCRPITHGDSLSPSIAAASIVAKVTRDRLMMAYDRRFPQYGFAQHKGYGTAFHRSAIARFGPCPIHRRSFRGVKEHLTS